MNESYRSFPTTTTSGRAADVTAAARLGASHVEDEVADALAFAGIVTPVWEIRPHTYTDRGVASLGYELVDDTGARRGIFDDVPTARLAANSRGADVRLSWAS